MENNQRPSLAPEVNQSGQVEPTDQLNSVERPNLFDQTNQTEQNNGPKIDEKAWESALELSVPAGLPKPEKFTDSLEQSGSSAEAPIDTPKESSAFPLNPFETPNGQELGKITSLDTASRTGAQPSYGQSNIRTTGDHLEKSSIVEIDNALNELNQTGNLNNFYEEIRSMTEANLNNSFNRKLYHDGLEPPVSTPKSPLGGGR